MALPKVCGIETEYGIIVRGGESNPVSASSLLINAFMATISDRRVAATGWDFNDEQPGNDARGFSLDEAIVPELETSLVNAVLTNGARYYVDHAHPEISNPETTTALEAVRWDRAAEEIIRISVDAANSQLAQTARASRQQPGEIVVYKNNSDGKGNSYGCHENYLMARETPFGRLATQITPHFVTRQMFCGAGKVGCEAPGAAHDSVPFQLSQRADFFEEEIGLETTLKRPIVNTRDEPHADAQKYRRLHVIVGDANLAEVATLPQGGHDPDRPGDDRGRRARRRLVAQQPRVGDPPGEPRPDAVDHRAARRRSAGDRAGDPVRAARGGREVRAAPRSGVRRRGGRSRRAGDGGSRSSPGSNPIRTRWPRGSTGSPSAASSTATPNGTSSSPATPG